MAAADLKRAAEAGLRVGVERAVERKEGEEAVEGTEAERRERQAVGAAARN